MGPSVQPEESLACWLLADWNLAFSVIVKLGVCMCVCNLIDDVLVIVVRKSIDRY